MNKKKKRKLANVRTRPYDEIIDNPVAVLVIGALAILFGIFFAVSQGDNKPIPRNEAISYYPKCR